MPQNEDEVIARGFLLVKEGILNTDWDKVCEAYKLISGEDIKPPVPEKSKLERIRDMMNAPPAEKAKPRGRKKKDSKEPAPQVLSAEDEEPQEVVLKKFKGGKRFAEHGFEVIEAGIDPAEQAKNLLLSQKKNPIPHQRSQKPKDNSDADVETTEARFHSKPKFKPPWH
jgi:hypothetical protein